MKTRYFKYVEIEKSIVLDFFSRHQELTKFINTNTPFYVRIYKKPYSGLIHTILSENETSEQLITKWGQLIDFAGKIKPVWVNHVKDEILIQIMGLEKAKLVRQVTSDVINNTLDLDLLMEQSEDAIINTLKQYKEMSLNTIHTFALFTCCKQNVLCETDPDFLKGLQIFLNKDTITPEDISKIKNEYQGQLTLFSLCMWRIKNERSK